MLDISDDLQQHGFRLLTCAALTGAAGAFAASWVLARTRLFPARVVAEQMRALEAAEAANRAKSGFLANMSHEIRTPLNAVLGMAQVLRHHRLSEDQARRLGLIEEAGESLCGLLNNVLELSRMEAGRGELDESWFDMQASVKAVARWRGDEANCARLSTTSCPTP